MCLNQEPNDENGLYLYPTVMSILSHPLPPSVIPFSCFLLLALQFSPELPKQRSGILSVPEHTWLLFLVSAELTVPPISPGPPVLTSSRWARPAQPRAQAPAICLHWKEPKKMQTMMPFKTHTRGRKTLYTEQFAGLIALLYWLKEDSCEVSSAPLPCMCSIVTSLIKCLI